MRFSIGLIRATRHFWRRQDGFAAVEAALLLPVMLVLYLGTVELSFGIIADRKLTVATQTAADLVTQYQVVNDGTIDSIYQASSLILQPYAAAPFGLDVTGITVGTDLKAKVTWTEHRGTGSQKNAVGQEIALPDALKVPNSFLVMVQADYVYTATTKYVMQTSVTLSDQFYMRPRLADKITFQ